MPLCLSPSVLTPLYHGTLRLSTTILHGVSRESREQTAQRQRDAARRALRDRVQSALDGALEDVDMRRLQDVLLQMSTAKPSTCEEISAIGHL